jgi:AcrB/AcrD/AcrF family protein
MARLTHGSIRRGGVAPRCRLVTSWGRSHSQGFGCSPIKVARELGSETFIIVAQVPVACLGGILALLVTGIPFSVSAAVGFISIFGIAAMDGILLTTYIRQLWDQRHPFVESIIMGSDRRLRATMKTDLVDALGFLPAGLCLRESERRLSGHSLSS